MVNILSRTDESLLSKWWWSIDKKLFKAIIVLAILGLFTSFSAPSSNASRANLETTSFDSKFLIFMAIGTIVFIFFAVMNEKWIRRTCVFGMVVILISLILLPIIGFENKGAIRWIHMFGFSLQPSEFAKPVFAVVSAWFFSSHFSKKNIPGIWMSTSLYLILAILFIIQPDLGQTIVLTTIWISQFFIAGLALSAILGFFVLSAMFIVIAYIFMPHVQDRINKWLMPTQTDSYQTETSLKAFAEGGWAGRGIGSGDVKHSLPDVHTDFVFAVWGEEAGVIGSVLLLGLFAYIIYRMLINAKKQDSFFALLSVTGIAIQFAVQTAINISSSIGLIPAKGMTLPLISSGGSSYVAISASLGIVIALTRKRKM